MKFILMLIIPPLMQIVSVALLFSGQETPKTNYTDTLAIQKKTLEQKDKYINDMLLKMEKDLKEIKKEQRKKK